MQRFNHNNARDHHQGPDLPIPDEGIYELDSPKGQGLARSLFQMAANTQGLSKQQLLLGCKMNAIPTKFIAMVTFYEQWIYTSGFPPNAEEIRLHFRKALADLERELASEPRLTEAQGEILTLHMTGVSNVLFTLLGIQVRADLNHV